VNTTIMRGIPFMFKRKIKYFVKNILILIKEKVLHVPLIFPDKNIVLILRTDNIGDYILFRNFLKILRGSPDYSDKKIILIGNENWRDLAEHFDKNEVDGFFWVNRKKFYQSKSYKISILYKLRKLRAYKLINTVHSRSLFEQDLISFSGARELISCNGDEINISFNNKNAIPFNKLIPSLSYANFEFFRNKYFFEKLLHINIDLKKTKFEIRKSVTKTNQIIIFPSAAEAFRRWSPISFSILINALNKYDKNLIFTILGSSEDIEIANEIIGNSSKNVSLNNLCGETSLVEVVNILSESRLLISNETSAVHIAVALDLPTVCISNGNHFGRFNPYPKTMTNKVITIYPNDSFYDENQYDSLVEKYKKKSELNINDILPDRVFEIAKRILEDN
jgi:ADP-heptose:LPS heptosyltransferase